jgi:hypothetical protein
MKGSSVIYYFITWVVLCNVKTRYFCFVYLEVSCSGKGQYWATIQQLIPVMTLFFRHCTQTIQEGKDWYVFHCFIDLFSPMSCLRKYLTCSFPKNLTSAKNLTCICRWEFKINYMKLRINNEKLNLYFSMVLKKIKEKLIWSWEP